MKQGLLILILVGSVYTASSQNQETLHVQINRDSLIKNYADFLPNDPEITIKGFIVSARISRGLVKDVVSTTGELTDDQIELIRQVKTGGMVYFDAMRVENAKGELESHKILVFELRE
jgi:hypothetical protein